MLSSDQFNFARTNRLADRVARHCPAMLDPATVDLLHWYSRKLGHFLGYALLALILMRAIRLANPLQRGLATATLVLAWCCLDEYHQSFTQLRNGRPADVALDFSGALAALAAVGLVYAFRLLRSRRRPAETS